MVKGLDTFRTYFKEYEEQYVFDANSLKNYGLKNEEVIAVLKRVFG